jgi:hypothetical protein
MRAPRRIVAEVLVIGLEGVELIAFDIDRAHDRISDPDRDDGFRERRPKGREIPSIVPNIVDDDGASARNSRAVQALCPREDRKSRRLHTGPGDGANL